VVKEGAGIEGGKDCINEHTTLSFTNLFFFIEDGGKRYGTVGPDASRD
jgi:hypothetical protein